VQPQPSWQEPDQRGEDRAAGPVQPGPGIGAAQHRDLVPQHQQPGVLGRRRTAGRTSRPQSRPKIRHSRRRTTADHDALRPALATAAAHRPGRPLAPRRLWCGRCPLWCCANSARTARRCRSPRIRMWSRHSRRSVPANRSADEFARGDRTGVLITRVPSSAKTPSDAAVNLLSRSRIKNLNHPARSSRS
jgi:hypothetical protein